MIYAIGDIHGNYDLLDSLYKNILNDIASVGDESNTIIFLGDYIDRGYQNQQVLDFLRNLQDSKGIEHIMLRGNHEDIFKNAMQNHRDPFFVRMWVDNGGSAFLKERQMDFTYFVNTYPWHVYVDWMDLKLLNYYETEDYVFVHGGVDIRIPNMENQDKMTLLWSRYTNTNHYKNFNKMVIHGHTPNPDPIVDKNRINVDTSFSYSAYPGIVRLTAVALPNRRNDDISPRFITAEKYIRQLDRINKENKK